MNTLLALQETADGVLGTKELIFLGLWVVFGGLFYVSYKSRENPLGAYLKVGLLLGFVYAVILGFDWLAAEVPAEQAITFGLTEVEPGTLSARVPLLANAFTWFVWVLLALVVWYAKDKFATVGGVVLSAWDRGHWYMLPVIFVLMTVGLLLVAAAASPVLSPFIYTLF